MLLDGCHPGENAGQRLGIYTKHRAITLHGYGMTPCEVANYLRLPQFVVEAVIREEAELAEERYREF